MRRFTQRKEKWKALAIYATLDHIQKNCYTSITDGEKLKNSLKQENLLLPLCIFIRNPVLYRINTNPTVMGICLFGRRSRYMFLDSEPEGEIQLPRSGMPLKEKKRTATLLPATEKIYMFLSSSPSVTKGKPFLFYSVKGSVRCSIFKFGSFFNM